MASNILLGPALLMDGISTDASVFRTFGIAGTMYGIGSESAAATLGGVLNGPGAMEVTAPGGLAVTVSAGVCVVPATLASNGAYMIGLMTSGALTVSTPDPTNPRIDLVCATVVDNGNSSSYTEVQIITGTPAPSPVAPSLPAQSVPLAYVTAPAGASTITSGNISDGRPWTGLVGSIVPVQGLVNLPAGYPGAFFYDLITGRLVHNPAGVAQQPVLLPFAPVYAKLTSSEGTASTINVLSVSVACNGSTDLDIYVKWPHLLATAGTPPAEARADMQIFIDSTQVDSMIVASEDGGTSLNSAGGAYHHYTDAAGTTPSAGVHTITWKMAAHYIGTDFIYIDAGNSYPAILRVSPVPL